MALIYIFVLTAIVLVVPSLAKPPENSLEFECKSMRPRHHAGKPEVLPSPFGVYISKKGTYRAGDVVTVKLEATRGHRFQSFFIQARRLDPQFDTSVPIGYWNATKRELGKRVCTGLYYFGSAMVSASTDVKSEVVLSWTAPDPAQGHVEFRVTFVDEDGQRFWLMERSEMIRDPDASPYPTLKPPYEPPPIEPIDTHECGIKKGCYREPPGCAEEWCEYIATWRDVGKLIEFEIGGYQDGFDDRWVALALSSDIRMGSDSVMECVHDSDTGKVEVFMSYNADNNKRNIRLENPKLGITKEEGSYYQGRLRCRFWRDKYIDSDQRLFPLTGGSWHLLMARGGAYKGNIHRHSLQVGYGKFPVASSSKVILQDNSNINGRARYPLVKAHGCLMLFAWIFCSTIGMLLVKYYKKMWPNSTFYGEKYWFVVHRSCMVTVFFAVVIAFILIFIEAGGYSEAPDLPQRAHPILGIIITICVIINPLIALLRPDDENYCRPVFNWIHFIFGLVGTVLAVPNVFIGMDFGKANVPYWATWILMFYFLFHLIVEVMLEVHQCCTHKKNKERRKKWELVKKEYPKIHHPEPNPVGHRFKRNTLWIHIIVTTIVAIVLIITLAVC